MTRFLSREGLRRCCEASVSFTVVPFNSPSTWPLQLLSYKAALLA